MATLIRKRKLEDIDPARLKEPVLTDRQWQTYVKGVDLFNAGRFWDAHEAWEEVWRVREEESRIFFQGIIQAAAGYHLLVHVGRPVGARNNLEKGLQKLMLFRGTFLGLKVESFRERLSDALTWVKKEGKQNASEVPSSLIPEYRLHVKGGKDQ